MSIATQATEHSDSSIDLQRLKRRRGKAALINLFIGDSLSMPVHWYYNPSDILRTFGKHGVTRLEAAPERHPSSIMSLHSTSGGGRARAHSGQQAEVVGKVILKGKRDLWNRPNGHYHHGLQAGDNTLNAWWARRLINHMVKVDQYDVSAWAEVYIDFMTADPPQHPDTYAESCHRGFFANWAAGTTPLQCGAVTHDTPSMGALVTVAPLALALLGSGQSVQQTSETCRDHVWLTHPDKGLLSVVDAYVQLINALLCAETEPNDAALFVEAASVIPGTKLDKLLASNKADNHVVGRLFSLACYITDSWPSVCFLAARYHDDVQRAMLTNTNLGGENAHRGSVLGSVVGLASGDYPEHWYRELDLHSRLELELDAFLDRYYPLPNKP